jgi:hypothetical protein
MPPNAARLGCRCGLAARFGGNFAALLKTFTTTAFLDLIMLLSHIDIFNLSCGSLIRLRSENMKNEHVRFNIILAFLLLFVPGCKTGDAKDKKSEATFLRFHLETNRDGTKHNATVPISRADPVYLTVERNAALDEGFIRKAEVVDVDEHGGFAIKITFDETGTQRLDYLTTANKGRHLVINARWTEDRWLAAPLINKRISNGVLVFTPDASREEADRIVEGLQNVIKKLSKPYVL